MLQYILSNGVPSEAFLVDVQTKSNRSCVEKEKEKVPKTWAMDQYWTSKYLLPGCEETLLHNFLQSKTVVLWQGTQFEFHVGKGGPVKNTLDRYCWNNAGHKNYHKWELILLKSVRGWLSSLYLSFTDCICFPPQAIWTFCPITAGGSAGAAWETTSCSSIRTGTTWRATSLRCPFEAAKSAPASITNTHLPSACFVTARRSPCWRWAVFESCWSPNLILCIKRCVKAIKTPLSEGPEKILKYSHSARKHCLSCSPPFLSSHVVKRLLCPTLTYVCMFEVVSVYELTPLLFCLFWFYFLTQLACYPLPDICFYFFSL